MKQEGGPLQSKLNQPWLSVHIIIIMASCMKNQGQIFPHMDHARFGQLAGVHFPCLKSQQLTFLGYLNWAEMQYLPLLSGIIVFLIDIVKLEWSISCMFPFLGTLHKLALHYSQNHVAEWLYEWEMTENLKVYIVYRWDLFAKKFSCGFTWKWIPPVVLTFLPEVSNYLPI